MTRLSTLVLRHKRLVVLCWLAVTAAGLAVSPTLSSRLSQQFTLPGQPAYQANLAILRSYGNGGGTLPLVLMPPSCQDSPRSCHPKGRTSVERVSELRLVLAARPALPHDPPP